MKNENQFRTDEYLKYISLPERSPPNVVELIPPRPREGAVVVVDITLVVSPVKGALDAAPNPNPIKAIS